jgi:hypothetical protein
LKLRTQVNGSATFKCRAKPAAPAAPSAQPEPKQVAQKQEGGQLELIEWDWGNTSYSRTLVGIVANNSEYVQTFVCITFSVSDKEGFQGYNFASKTDEQIKEDVLSWGTSRKRFREDHSSITLFQRTKNILKRSEVIFDILLWPTVDDGAA